MILSILFGLLAGPFLNLLADRLPGNQPLLDRATCPSCGRDVSPLAYVAWLRLVPGARRVHNCDGHVMLSRHVLVEASTVALFYLSWRELGSSWSLVPVCFVLCVLLVVFVVDLEHRLVPNKLILPASAVALVFTLIQRGALATVLGGLIGLGFFAVAFAVFPRGLGMGDVKLGLFIGLAVGWPEVLPSLAIGVCLGGLIPLVLLLTGHVGRRSYLPYAPFLATGAMVGVLFGTEIVRGYLRLYGA